MVGFNVHNRQQINPSYLCRHCSLLLRDPIQFAECGHHQCQSCSSPLNPHDERIVCSVCQQTVRRATFCLDRGLKNDLQSLLVTCGWCNWTDVLRNYPEHLDQIHRRPLCLHCQVELNSIDELNEHLFSTCEKILLECPLPQIGCTEKILRIHLAEHLLSESHQTLLANFLRSLSGTSPRPAISPDDGQLQSTAEILMQSLGVLKTDLTRLEKESVGRENHLLALREQISRTEDDLKEKDLFFARIRSEEERIGNDLSFVQQQFDTRLSDLHDGTFLWTINGVQQKIADADSDRQTSIYSPVFYTSPTGYKLRLRLYLTGDAGVRRSHLSLFLVLMRGDYDAILSFPFCYKVIFTLYDQSESKNHHVDFFQPNPTSNSFRRPRTEMNTASGLSKFLPLDTLHDPNRHFIDNDTMFIQVTIDFSHLAQR